MTIMARTDSKCKQLQGKEVEDLEKQLRQLSFKLCDQEDQGYRPSMLGYREEELSISSRTSSAPSIAASLSEISPHAAEHPR